MSDKQQVKSITIHCNSVYNSFCSLSIEVESAAGQVVRKWEDLIMGTGDRFEIDTEPKVEISWYSPDGQKVNIEMFQEDKSSPIYRIVPVAPLWLKSGDTITLNFTVEA